MAKKQVKREEQVPDEGEESAQTRSALDEMEEDAEESLARDLQFALSEVGDGGQVSIHVTKLQPKDEAGACTAYASGELSIDRLRDEWGAGVFRLVFRAPTGRIITRRQLSVVAKKVQAQPATAAEVARLMEEKSAGKGDGGMASMIPLIMKVMDSNTQQMVALLSRPAPTPPAPPPPMGPQEIIAMMTGLANMMKPSESQVDLLLKGVKLFKDLQPEGDSDSLTGLLSKGLDLAGNMVGKVPAPAQVPPRPSVTVTQVKPPPAIETPEAVAPTDEQKAASLLEAKVAWLREQLRRLVEKAERGRDPALYADLLLDELPEFVVAADLRGALLDSEWFAQLSLLNSDVSKYRAWFTEFRDCIAERLDEAQPSEPAAPSENAQPAGGLPSLEPA